MKKIGVILSGCGVRDGSEIHEAVIALLAIDRNGGKAICMAPDIELDEINHLSLKETGAKRNVLVEAARIARSEISDIKNIKAAELDALVLPGGFGAATNLTNFASHGPNGTVQPDVLKLVREMAIAKKPICAICMAPAVVGLALGKDFSPQITIGNDMEVAQHLTKVGCWHKICAANDCVVDEENKVVTTPAYMLATHIAEAADGIEKAIKATFDLMK